jgi:hypothetical protein
MGGRGQARNRPEERGELFPPEEQGNTVISVFKEIPYNPDTGGGGGGV